MAPLLGCLVLCLGAADGARAQGEASEPSGGQDVGTVDKPAAEGEDAENEKKRLLVLDFRGGEISEDTVETLADLTTSAIGETDRFEVISGSELRDMMSLEAQKQAVGCEDASCLAEIAGALGADLVLTGRVGRLGELYVLKLTVIEPAKARTLARETVEVAAIEKLAALLRPVAARLAAASYGEEMPVEKPVVAMTSPGGEAGASASAGADESGGGPGLGTLLLFSGGGVAALGVVGVAVGAGAAVWARMVVQDPVSGGDDKDSARGIGPLAASAALGAVGVVALGGAVAGAGFFVE